MKTSTCEICWKTLEMISCRSNYVYIESSINIVIANNIVNPTIINSNFLYVDKFFTNDFPEVR